VNEAVARLAAAPGIVAAGAISSLPLSGAEEGGGLRIAGRPVDPSEEFPPHAQYNVVAGDFFGTMRIRAFNGRLFDNRDDAPGAASIIVNREFVRKYYPAGTDVVGRAVTPMFLFNRGPEFTIVGVVDNVKQTSLDAEPQPQVYVRQTRLPYPGLVFVARVDGDPLAAISTVKRAVAAADPTATVNDIRTMDDVLDHSLARQRFSMTLIAVFAVSALVLALVGLYGVIALIVGQRKREIGVRVALGARPADVVRMVLGESARVTLAGIVAGILGAVALTRVMAALLYDTSTTDTVTFVGASLLVMAVSIAAGFVPARRASRVDPTVALRAD
jgi:predicted permease